MWVCGLLPKRLYIIRLSKKFFKEPKFEYDAEPFQEIEFFYGISEEISIIFMGFQRFWRDSKDSDGIPKIPVRFQRFQRFRRDSKDFKDSNEIPKIPKIPERFQRFQWDSKDSNGIPKIPTKLTRDSKSYLPLGTNRVYHPLRIIKLNVSRAHKFDWY